MAVNLSPVGGVAAQFFTNTGAVLTGGKLYTYLAGTTTPATAYTTSQGTTAWTNPIVLDAAGRVSGSGEIWITDGIIYKFVLKDANDVLIATYDNITGINSNSVAYTNQQEIITATAGQTVFNLTISFQPGTNSLSVFVDGVNQYGPGAQYSYVETDSDTVTFASGLHVGAEVKFTTTQQQGAGAVNASQVTYNPAGTGAVAESVQTKLRQTVSVMDFGAVGDGVTDDTAAVQAAINQAAISSGIVIFPVGTFKITSALSLVGLAVSLKGAGPSNTIIKASGALTTMVDIVEATDNLPNVAFEISGMQFDGNSTALTALTIQYRHNYSISDVFIQFVATGITTTSCYIGYNKNVRVQATATGLNMVGSNHSTVYENCTITSFGTAGIALNNAALGDGNQGINFIGCTVQSGVGFGIYINSNASTINFIGCYIGEEINGNLFYVEGGVVNVTGTYIQFGYAAGSYAFNIASQTAFVEVEGCYITSAGVQTLEGLVFAPTSGSPAISGKIKFVDVALSATYAGGVSFTGDPINFGPSQVVFATRYGKNYTVASSDTTVTQTTSNNEKTFLVTGVTGASPKASMYVSLVNWSERFNIFAQRAYIVVVYKSNKSVEVTVSSGSGKVAPFKVLGTIPSSASISGLYSTFVLLDSDAFDAAYTTLEFNMVNPTTNDTFTLREVYFADQRMITTAPGTSQCTANIYKC